MATLIIPADPRVVSNAEALTESILKNHSLESLHLNHDLIVVSEYGKEAEARRILSGLAKFFHSSSLKVLTKPYVSSFERPYGVINAMFRETMAAVSISYSRSSTRIIPCVWYGEKGNELFEKDALDQVDAMFAKNRAMIFGRARDLPAVETNYVKKPARRCLEGTFVIPYNLLDTGKGAYPNLGSIPDVEHFRPFLGDDMTAFDTFLEVPEKAWREIFSVNEKYIDNTYLLKQQHTLDVDLPSPSANQSVTTPSEVPTAFFNASKKIPTVADPQSALEYIRSRPEIQSALGGQVTDLIFEPEIKAPTEITFGDLKAPEADNEKAEIPEATTSEEEAIQHERIQGRGRPKKYVKPTIQDEQ